MGTGRRARRAWIGAVCAAAAVSIAGCGDDDDESAGTDETTTGGSVTSGSDSIEDFASPNPDSSGFAVEACSLLTEADVKKILGKAVEGKLRAKPDPESGQPGQCFWESGESVDLAAPHPVPFSVAASAGDGAWYANNLSLVEEDESFEALDGIGDEAFAGDTRGGVLIGDAGLTVELGIAAEPASHESAVDALERVASNYR
jgi:hypothetical protein